MRKSKEVAKTIKLIVKLLVLIIRKIAVIVPYLAKAIYESISKQLKFSITFKTAITYSFTFARIYFLISTLILVAFGGFLYFEVQDSLQKSIKVTEEFLRDFSSTKEASTVKDISTAKGQIKRFAEIQGMNITLLNRGMGIVYTTSDVGSIPNDIQGHNDLTILNQRVYLRSELTNNSLVMYILVSRSIEKEIIYLIFLTTGLTFSFIIAILIIVIKGSKTLKKMLKPIDDMINTTRSISANDLHTRLNVVNSHDELKELAETFNEMLERIQISYEKQNRFVSDASHELRTPISVIQGYANLLQRWGKEDKEVLGESLIAIKNEAENMKELVERLLFLARADKDTQKVEKGTFSLNELIDEIIRETKLIDSQHEITNETNCVLVFNADRGLIKQAIRIFIDNSIKFTPTGGTIKINSIVDNRQAKISIEDNGVGISAADLPFVFDRFYKCDESRNRGKGGTGLGLSIAKWIIEKHSGSVNVESALEKGTKIEINLPI